MFRRKAGERADPLSQALVHIATRGEKWFALSNHERQQLIEALKRSGEHSPSSPQGWIRIAGEVA
ncbi:hypothetical protein [Vibrio neptunius]|uniref:hypothetical protein n=1 Tax=Vibrio neptunius TaxID=170651 RepID=UPI001F09231E|nr:hypothetical protein [Vibrio neptunius]